jgi:hypothetical protein
LGVKPIDKIFIGKVAAKKVELDITNEDIANMTGFQKSTIDSFMCGRRDSDTVKNSIAKVLGIER